MSRVQLAIIGGGLVGASLALALQDTARQRGWRIALIEPFAPGSEYQPSYDARSTALSYGSRLIYERLGLWQSIASGLSRFNRFMFPTAAASAPRACRPSRKACRRSVT